MVNSGSLVRVRENKQRWTSTQSKVLGKRRLLLSGVLLIALLLTVGLTLFEHYASAIQTTAHANLEAIATSKKQQLENALHERFSDGKLLALREPVIKSLEKNVGNTIPVDLLSNLQRTLQETGSIYGYREIGVFNTRLQRIAPAGENTLQPNERIALQSALDTRRGVLLDIHVSEAGTPVFGVIQPVFAQGNAQLPVVGMVYLEMDASVGIYPVLAPPVKTARTLESLVLRREGDEVLYVSPLLYADAAKPLSIRRSLRNSEFGMETNAQAGGQGLATRINGIDYRGVRVIRVALPIEGTPWHVILKIDEDEVNQPITQVRDAILTGAVLLTLIWVGAARLLWRTQNAENRARELVLGTRYAAARQASFDGYMTTDSQGVIIEVNEACVKLTGFSLAELLAKKHSDLDPIMATAHGEQILAQLRRSGATTYQTQWQTKQGNALLLRVSSTFLPDSDVGTFQSFVHDIGPEQQALERITRLQNFYAFLSKVNAAIFNLKDRDAILNTVCESALWHGDFVLAWAGVPEDHIGMVVPVAICGEASDYVKSLRITTDPALPTSQGPTRQCMVDGKIHYTDDFQSDARTLPWHEFGHKYGLNSSAAIPVLAAGKAVAVLTFYSAIKGFFDLEMRALLEETARNVSQALQLAEAEWARSSSMLAHHVSEERFARVFSASPVPMQISSVSSRRIRSINKAHERTFGFSMEEISSESNWFEAVYPDPVFRAQMQEIWYQHALPEAMQGGPERVVTSPEIRLRCKSGAERIMRGFMSVVGDDAVTQWEDLTELKDAETRLAQDEARFRSLIEQTLTGIYVTQDSKIVYANPRFCEILGQHTEDLIGRDPQELIAQTPQARHMLKNESERIQSGELGQLMALPFTTRDGKRIDLGMQANIGLWNGRPAVIVISQDITERRRAEEKIATYVKQLEGTMRGTLQAVANMVDLRDPYTSGHERRVGVIAADIAREMGWSEDRCQSLQLIGLVHDIGKIAIPAEILSKPTRLTALEYEMVKTHAESGFEILKDVEFPMPIAEIIREHHERMDGSGYPHGLLGNAIMPEARVLAVADVLESMASHRPYRPALGLAAAMDEIESHRATWFDPQVVDATLRLLRDKAYELPK